MFTELDKLEHDTTIGRDNSLIMLDATHFVLAYNGTLNDGFIKTFSVDGSFVITEIDSLEHDTTFGADHSLVKIDATHFALAYNGGTGVGILKTFSVNGSFVITELDAYTYADQGSFNSLVLIDSTHLAVASKDTIQPGQMNTFSLDGSFVITELDEFEFEPTTADTACLFLIDSTHFLLVYYDGNNNVEKAETFSIDGSFVISEINSISLSANLRQTRDKGIVQIDSTHFLVATSDADFTGLYLTVLSIDGSYNLTEESNTLIDANMSINAETVGLVKIDANNFILASAGTDDDGFVKKIYVSDTYTVHLNEENEFDTVNAERMSLVNIDDENFIIAYMGSGDDGFILTFSYVAPTDTSNYLCFV